MITKERALQILCDDINVAYFTAEEREAYDMAVNALKAEQYGKATINAIKNAAAYAGKTADVTHDWEPKAYFTGKREGLTDALNIIKDYEDKNTEAIEEAIEELQEMW